MRNEHLYMVLTEKASLHQEGSKINIHTALYFQLIHKKLLVFSVYFSFNSCLLNIKY